MIETKRTHYININKPLQHLQQLSIKIFRTININQGCTCLIQLLKSRCWYVKTGPACLGCSQVIVLGRLFKRQNVLPPTLWCVSRSQQSVLSMSGKYELVLSHSCEISWSTVSNYLDRECLIILIFIDWFNLVFTGCLLGGDMECGWMGVRLRREMVGTEYKPYSGFGVINPFVKVKPHDPYWVSSKCQRKSVLKDGELPIGESQWSIW